ncbi:hypothetical protein HanIR_Chr12g0608371 [Helianthus annuus]|nr:hypothetical protein HanIR_Chr12g0608371 [Helianthus annuus]
MGKLVEKKQSILVYFIYKTARYGPRLPPSPPSRVVAHRPRLLRRVAAGLSKTLETSQCGLGSLPHPWVIPKGMVLHHW